MHPDPSMHPNPGMRPDSRMPREAGTHPEHDTRLNRPAQASTPAKLPPLTVLVFYGVVLLLLIQLVSGYAAFLHYLYSNSGTLLWKAYDWPDTAVMVQSVMDGRFFSGYPEAFISGKSMFGLFPPLLPLLAGIINLAIGNIATTFVLLSAVLSLLISYFTAKDWPAWPQKLIVVLFLFCYPIIGDVPPFIVRLRELFAVFLLVLLFKNPFRMKPEKNYLILGLLLILSQPLVAVIGLLSYPFLNQDNWKIKADLRSFAIFAALVLAFTATYHQHILLNLPGGAANTNSLGQCLPKVYGIPLDAMLSLFSVPALFFFVFSRNNLVRGVFLLFTLWWFSLIVFSENTGLLSLLAFPVKDDFSFQTLPFFAFFALFPPPGKPKDANAKHLLCALLVLTLLLANLKIDAPLNSAGAEEMQFRNLAGALQNHSKIASLTFYAVESKHTFFFSGSDFRLISEIFLKKLPVQAYYSPFQSFYDTEGFYAPVSGLIGSINEKNSSACASFARGLSAKADYLHLGLSVIHNGDRAWSGRALASLADRGFLEKCGISLVADESGNGTDKVQILYRFNPAGTNHPLAGGNAMPQAAMDASAP